jgi:hypothetical protein
MNDIVFKRCTMFLVLVAMSMSVFFKHHGGSIHEATPKWMLYDENDPSKVKMDDLRLSPHLQKPDETMISHVFLCTLW